MIQLTSYHNITAACIELVTYSQPSPERTPSGPKLLSRGGGGVEGGRGVIIIFLRGGVPPGPENPYPISDQNIRISIPYFKQIRNSYGDVVFLCLFICREFQVNQFD